MSKNYIQNKIKELELEISKLKKQAKEENIREDIATIELTKTEKTNIDQIISKDKIELIKEGMKTNKYIIKYKRDGNKIICNFIRSTILETIVGIGIARCNPKDEFDYETGILIAELRARSDFYKKIADNYINKIN